MKQNDFETFNKIPGKNGMFCSYMGIKKYDDLPARFKKHDIDFLRWYYTVSPEEKKDEIIGLLETALKEYRVAHWSKKNRRKK